jgi:UTP--glucose-1-phosphate uridylyltransferase
MTKVKKAVFPVAGLGTRFLPATKAMPKEMLTIVDRPLIQYVVEEAKAAGIEEFIFVTGRGKSCLEDHFDHAYELEDTLNKRGKTGALKELMSWLPEAGNVIYTRQQAPLGLGHAVWCARHIVGNEPFAVLLPDELVLSETPCLQQMMDVYDKVGGNVLATMDVPAEHTNRYGILEVKSDEGDLVEITGLVEKPEPANAPSNLSITGRYILQPEIFDILERKEQGAGNEIQLTDAMARMIGHSPFHGYRFEGERLDCGHALGFLQANIAFALKRDELASELKEFIKELV